MILGISMGARRPGEAVHASRERAQFRQKPQYVRYSVLAERGREVGATLRARARHCFEAGLPSQIKICRSCLRADREPQRCWLARM